MWLVDAGNNVVVRFNAKGRIVQALGRRLEPWVYLTHGIERAIPGPASFYQPTAGLPGWFDSIHAIACPDEKTVYVANEFSYRFDKVVRPEVSSNQRRSVTFWARQFQTSPTIRSFSVRQSMALTMPNSFGSLPALPNLPTTWPLSWTL